MSIAVLTQVYDETRRLAIAGGAVASGDFRLKKLIAPLEQAGVKAPVFTRVAQAAQAVVDSNEKTASAALLDLASLVSAILYTQGETGAAGELKPLATTDLGVRETTTSARVLKPLLEALKTTGSGRIELVKDAIERGTFRDLRLVKPAVHALDDSYSEIADVIARKVLPMYGKAIVPELRSQLDIKSKASGHQHRLRLLHKLDPEGTQSLVRQVLEEGSKEMRVVAIECLGTTGDDLTFLLDQAKAKAKDVRAAALRALGSAASSVLGAMSETMATLKKAIDSADIELIVEQLRKSKSPEILDHVVAQAQAQLASTLATKDAKEQATAVERLMHFARSVQGRSDDKAQAFLLRCFDSLPALLKIKSTPSGADFAELLANIMSRGTPKLQQTLAASHKTLSGEMLVPAFDAARATMTPQAFFEEFSPLLKGFAAKRGKKGSDNERALSLAVALREQARRGYSIAWHGYAMADELDDAGEGEGSAKTTLRELDKRWLDAAIDEKAYELVYELARPQHARTIAFLSEHVASLKPDDAHRALETMVRIGHPGAGDAIIEALKKQAKSTHWYYGYWYGRLIAELPASELPKFEALLPTLPEKMVDQVIEWVMELKAKADKTT